MLVFRRQPGESFRIGEAVEVRILEIARGQVKIGVEAPREVGIYRTEISEMNRQAALENPRAPQVRSAAQALRRRLGHGG
jgi:carbon storage regulator